MNDRIKATNPEQILNDLLTCPYSKMFRKEYNGILLNISLQYRANKFDLAQISIGWLKYRLNCLKFLQEKLEDITKSIFFKYRIQINKKLLQQYYNAKKALLNMLEETESLIFDLSTKHCSNVTYWLKVYLKLNFNHFFLFLGFD